MATETPSEIELVRDFLNTRDVEKDREEVGHPAALGRWLAGRGLLAPKRGVTEEEHVVALRLREALRAVLSAHHDGSASPEALEEMNAVAATLPLRLRFDDLGHAEVQPAGDGVTGSLGAILGDVALATSTGSWDRLKTCSNEGCRWAFYDRSKNRSGRWCSMSECGNRSKTRRYRARRSST